MIYIFVLTTIILALVIVFQNIKIHSISDNIKEVIDGNFNERIRIYDYNPRVKDLIIDLNKLIDEFQKIVSLNKQYEDDRKKMISNISHDFRTPLTTMLGYIEMLREDNSLNDKENMEYLEIISTKGEILRGLIEEFFSLSKFDSSDVVLTFKRVNISEIMRQCILSFLKDFEINGIELVIDISSVDIFIRADEVAIYRVLQNLIANALRYGAEGKVIGVSLEGEMNSVVLKIWDRGRGIPQEEIPYIFKRLYSVDKSRNNRQTGSGLGLTIVKKLVEKHEGIIEVSSKPYEKTTFKITLRNIP
ncbi:sensor histidine kinase [Clostridium estertheticum]|uniref:histidine kinase n=1 Tax=Clostridium estertheticum TaxID=238834 RepID=A0A7Y3STS9_9CLOT|nr:HAMP domain-containing sensor histidine kinase [Clostridium estertheticum]MBW9172124.1 HAMP domain-containing histidine kinase [Clostridium estertheticum]NNU75231.1 HAMP domain-containing histidine kinase [Clostridium estertheticum]WBL48299.1 HAMP domain-containing histidine kinase [Clostridium estertheticum]WLC76374.1 HAMP domain-containing histidine kinase [Clostridium estertheticum]